MFSEWQQKQNNKSYIGFCCSSRPFLPKPTRILRTCSLHPSD
jgi:hypothetical protein